MRIEPMDVVVPVAAGVVDEVLEWQDEVNARTTPVQQWATWSRIGLAAVGYLGQMFNFFPLVCRPLAQVETALVTKTVGSWIRTPTPATASAMRSNPGRRVGNPAARISQTPGTGFKGLETY